MESLPAQPAGRAAAAAQM